MIYKQWMLSLIDADFTPKFKRFVRKTCPKCMNYISEDCEKCILFGCFVRKVRK